MDDCPRGKLADDRPRLVGTSPAIARLNAAIDDFARYDFTVLILGPSGSGKELVAREIHDRSPRRGKPFVALNCAAITDSLLESELFGVRDRSVTNVAARAGLIAEAEGGTLFLDEVGDLSMTAQAKLLRFVATRTYYQVGSSKPVTADVRIVAATNRDLPAESRAGRFRSDLYYRLSECIVETPPLGAHAEDLKSLVSQIIAEYSPRMQKNISGISGEACAALERYPFEGNVRELRNIIGEAMAREKGNVITISSLRRCVVEQRSEPALESPAPSLSPLDAAHRALAVEYMARAQGRVATAARLIGVDRKTLMVWLERFGLSPFRKSA